MTTYFHPDYQGPLRFTKRLPALKDGYTPSKNTLAQISSSPGKLESSLEHYGRKRLENSVYKPKRVASLNRKSPKNEDITFKGKVPLYSPPKSSSNSQTKMIELPKKPRSNSSATSDIFNERFQQLQLYSMLPNSEPSRNSQKAYGSIKAFGVCTNQGLVRDYNEDRVSIILDIPRPHAKGDVAPWPNCNIFAIFDGHGGAKCADYLRNNLHYHIIHNRWFPTDPEEALNEACEAAEKRFIENQLTAEEGQHDCSGSCGLVMLIVEDTCYVCNVGDSRAVLSRNSGKMKQAVTRDHKPCDESEKMRIVNAGGRIYQNFPSIPSRLLGATSGPVYPVASGPFRLLPGGLAVSRAFGDIEAKIPKFGGNSNVLIAKPEITTMKINKSTDFIVLGSDGIFDVMSNDEVIQCVWDTIEKENTKDIHELMRTASENIIREALLKKSYDNVTAIVVAFPPLAQKINPAENVRVESENKETLFLSPKPSSRPHSEDAVSEIEDQKLSPPKTTLTPNHRAEKITPSKLVITSFSKTMLKREIGLKPKEAGKNEIEGNLPVIFSRGSVTKTFRVPTE